MENLFEEYFKKFILEPIIDMASLDSISIPIVSDNNLKIKYIEDQLESHLKLMNGFAFSDIPKLI